MRALALALLVLFLAGCGKSWSREAEVRLTNGSVYLCLSGLTFLANGVTCHSGSKDIFFDWKSVAGYTAR